MDIPAVSVPAVALSEPAVGSTPLYGSTATGGPPIKRALFAEIERRGGWDVAVFDRVADGETIKEIAASIPIERDTGGEPIPISRSFLSRWIHDDPYRERMLKLARKRSAGAHVDNALDIADQVPPTRDDVAKARLQVDTRFRTAAAYDKEQFGQKPVDVAVQVNFGNLYLDALRTRSAADEIQPSDVEILDDHLPRAEPAAAGPRAAEGERADDARDRQAEVEAAAPQAE